MCYSVVTFLLAGYCSAICSIDRTPVLQTLQQSWQDRCLPGCLCPSNPGSSIAGATLDVPSESTILQCSGLEACAGYFQSMKTHAWLNRLVNVKKQTVGKLCLCQLTTANVYLALTVSCCYTFLLISSWSVRSGKGNLTYKVVLQLPLGWDTLVGFCKCTRQLLYSDRRKEVKQKMIQQWNQHIKDTKTVLLALNLKHFTTLALLILPTVSGARRC